MVDFHNLSIFRIQYKALPLRCFPFDFILQFGLIQIALAYFSLA